MSRLLKLLVVLGVITFVTQINFSSTVEAAGTFRLTPASYSINLTNTNEVELEFKLSNDGEESLEFSAGLSEESKQLLSENGLTLNLTQKVAATQSSDLNVDDASVTLPARTTSSVVVILKPTKALDYELEIPIVLTQNGGARRLTTSSYNLTLKINSTIQSIEQSQLNTLVIFAAAILAIVLVSGSVILVRKLKRNGQTGNQ